MTRKQVLAHGNPPPHSESGTHPLEQACLGSESLVWSALENTWDIQPGIYAWILNYHKLVVCHSCEPGIFIVSAH